MPGDGHDHTMPRRDGQVRVREYLARQRRLDRGFPTLVAPWTFEGATASSWDLALAHLVLTTIDLRYLLLYNSAAMFCAASGFLDNV